MLALQNTILEMIASGEPLHATMDRLCREIEQRLPGVACSVLAVDLGGLLHPVAGPRIPVELCAMIEGLPIGPMVGSCGTAAYFNAPVAVTDIASDPKWEPFRTAALRAGLAACWSSPIGGANGRVLGAFAFYYREPRGPTRQEQRIVETCVHLSTIAFERHERVLEREHRATHDELTRLGNRADFNAVIARMSCAQPGSWGLFAIDLDNLKIVNDTYGHHAGDALLRVAAARIAEAVAPDVTFRIGGDEFVVVLQSPQALADIDGAAGRIFLALAESADCAGFRITPEASIGGAVLAEGDDLAETVREHADHALYVAKGTGRGRFVRYWPGIGSPITERIHIAHKIEAALDEGRIDAWYQPIIDLDSDRLVGLEALCRLTDGNGQVLTAAALDLAASDAQAVLELTRHMARVAASDLARWQANEISPPFIALNVSAADLHSPHFAEDMVTAFDASGVGLDRLVLDVNELIQHGLREAPVLRAIGQLRERGVRIALDDFGKGYASLSDLIVAPVDILKLDPAFIGVIGPNIKAAAVVSGLISIANQLNIDVVAEGVETRAQHDHLLRLGCRFGQGHYFSPALHRDNVETLLASPQDWHEHQFQRGAARRV